MNHPALFPLRVRHGDGRGEVAVVGDASVAAHPLVVPLSGVSHGPRDDGVVLAVGGVALRALAGHAAADAVVVVTILQRVSHCSIFKSEI